MTKTAAGCLGSVGGGIFGAVIGVLLGEAYLSAAKIEAAGTEHVFSLGIGILGMIFGGVAGLIGGWFLGRNGKEPDVPEGGKKEGKRKKGTS